MGDSSLRPVVCLRTKDKGKMKKVEEKEDCFILEFDPSQEFYFSNKSSVSSYAPDLQLVAQKGKIACRDFPHPRHLCGRFSFRETPHDKHCKLCYCYVCDLPAPCKYWVGGTTSHCHAFDNETWGAMRKSVKLAKPLPVKSAMTSQVASRHHWRYECGMFPFEKTPHDKHCKLCDCYVCDLPAPCKYWVGGTTSHCHAFNNETWGAMRKSVKRAKPLPVKSATTTSQVASRLHWRYECGMFPFGKTPHDKHCKLCYCYVCDFPAPCKYWVGGTTSHCHAFNNETWGAMRKSVRQAKPLLVKSAITTSQVASRLHWRYECGLFPFGKTPHDKHCKLCHCYVCDLPAPCKFWVAHCHALDDNPMWIIMRTWMTAAKTLPVKSAITTSGASSRRHRRHECVKFPIATTSHENHCELCNCYVCEKPAPCAMWHSGSVADGLLSGHCHAFSNERWRMCREYYQKNGFLNTVPTIISKKRSQLQVSNTSKKK